MSVDFAVDYYRVGQSCLQTCSYRTHPPTPPQDLYWILKLSCAWILDEGSAVEVADGTDWTRLGGRQEMRREHGALTWTLLVDVLALSSCSTTRKDCALDLEPALLQSHQKFHPFKCKPELTVQISSSLELSSVSRFWEVSDHFALWNLPCIDSLHFSWQVPTNHLIKLFHSY